MHWICTQVFPGPQGQAPWWHWGGFPSGTPSYVCSHGLHWRSICSSSPWILGQVNLMWLFFIESSLYLSQRGGCPPWHQVPLWCGQVDIWLCSTCISVRGWYKGKNGIQFSAPYHVQELTYEWVTTYTQEVPHLYKYPPHLLPLISWCFFPICGALHS